MSGPLTHLEKTTWKLGSNRYKRFTKVTKTGFDGVGLRSIYIIHSGGVNVGSELFESGTNQRSARMD
jgi:hypothetical protein